jgi:hypothetical protein
MITNIVVGHFRRVTDLVHLFSLETRLAGRTLIRIIILVVIMIMLIIVTWVCVILILFTLLVAVHFSALSAALMITLLNLILLSVVVISILRIRHNLFFPATRRQLSHKGRVAIKKDNY